MIRYRVMKLIDWVTGRKVARCKRCGKVITEYRMYNGFMQKPLCKDCQWHHIMKYWESRRGY